MRRNFCRLRLCVASLMLALVTCDSSYAARSSRNSESSDSLTVVIDAGHGGHDRGGIPGQRVAEKNMTLDVAQRLRNVLSANGCRVVMNRSPERFVTLGGL